MASSSVDGFLAFGVSPYEHGSEPFQPIRETKHPGFVG